MDRAKTNLKVNHRHKFSTAFRAEHKTAPELVPWIAGLVAVRTEVGWQGDLHGYTITCSSLHCA